MEIDKTILLKALIGHMEGRLESLTKAYESSHRGSIEAPGRNQSRYDSSKEELGVIADGLNKKKLELESALRSLNAQKPCNNSSVQIGSFVDLRDEETGHRSYYFAMPFGGGVILQLGNIEVTVITPAAPLFRAMVGCLEGGVVSLSFDKFDKVYKVMEVR